MYFYYYYCIIQVCVMPPCERQGPHLEPSQFQVAVKWWLGLDTSGDAQCALCPESRSSWPSCHNMQALWGCCCLLP